MQRSFYVGDVITEADVDAKFENGVLEISVPKKVENHRYIAIAG
jgi:Molecular chaperone (small heat shock protein)